MTWIPWRVCLVTLCVLGLSLQPSYAQKAPAPIQYKERGLKIICIGEGGARALARTFKEHGAERLLMRIFIDIGRFKGHFQSGEDGDRGPLSAALCTPGEHLAPSTARSTRRGEVIEVVEETKHRIQGQLMTRRQSFWVIAESDQVALRMRDIMRSDTQPLQGFVLRLPMRCLQGKC